MGVIEKRPIARSRGIKEKLPGPVVAAQVVKGRVRSSGSVEELRDTATPPARKSVSGVARGGAVGKIKRLRSLGGREVLGHAGIVYGTLSAQRERKSVRADGKGAGAGREDNAFHLRGL